MAWGAALGTGWPHSEASFTSKYFNTLRKISEAWVQEEAEMCVKSWEALLGGWLQLPLPTYSFAAILSLGRWCVPEGNYCSPWWWSPWMRRGPLINRIINTGKSALQNCWPCTFQICKLTKARLEASGLADTSSRALNQCLFFLWMSSVFNETEVLTAVL